MMVSHQEASGDPGLETNARPLARGELNSGRASGSSDLTSPVGEWIYLFFIFFNFIFYFFFIFRITIIILKEMTSSSNVMT